MNQVSRRGSRGNLRPLRMSLVALYPGEGEQFAIGRESPASSPNGAVQARPGQRPGLDFQRRKPLKGRPNGAKFSAPFQGSRPLISPPRTLPWARLVRPVGANDTFRRDLNLLSRRARRTRSSRNVSAIISGCFLRPAATRTTSCPGYPMPNCFCRELA